MEQYTTFDIVKKMKIPRERLQEWLRRGLVKPSVRAKGVGTKNIFTREDLYRIVLFSQLIDHHQLERETASLMIKGLDDAKPAPGRKEAFPEHNWDWNWSTAEFILCVEETPSLPGEVTRYTFQAMREHAEEGARETPLSLALRQIAFRKDWKNFTVINFKEIREQVDRALE